MPQTAAQTEHLLLALLEQWGDALTRLQVGLPTQPELDGGILCPCCKMIHGRCHEAAYPLLTLARRTGRREYLTAAKKVFRWGENMLRPDGSLVNDAKSDWRGTTVFGALALHDALFYHGDLLTASERAAWEDRLARLGGWAYENLRPGRLQAYLNYYAANACLMALLGRYFQNAAYSDLSRELAAFCLSHTGESGLLYGEGRPLDATTDKGCRAVDAGGYNVEETLPLLTRCAECLGDGDMLARVRERWRAHLIWMLPDGAWDDSAGSRAFKWTYWGSRTADGCQEALFALGRQDPVFAEAALRNAELYARCTHNGLLYGGPDYVENGELPCVHHTFCHAKTLAGSLNGGLYDFPRVPLPTETARGVRRLPELDLLRVTCGGWIADVTGYDYARAPGDHAAGGTLSLLWHKRTGPLLACGAADYQIKEPLNQQLPSDPSSHRCACPRMETVIGDVRYAQYYDLQAKLGGRETSDGATVFADARLCGRTGDPLPENGALRLQYAFTADSLCIRGETDPAIAARSLFVLPLIGAGAAVSVTQGALSGEPERFFNLNPGFRGFTDSVQPDRNGIFALVISV